MTHPFSLDKRTSGVLLHLTSLPGPHGVGDLGGEAHRFAHFLHDARQTWWQMFPLGPPGMSNSPYQVLSAFAGNPLLINLENLVEEGLLEKSVVERHRLSEGDAHFEAAWKLKKNLFRQAFAVFTYKNQKLQPEFEAFCEQEKNWLDDYALYCAIKGQHKGASWEEWEMPLRLRHTKALKEVTDLLRRSVEYHQFLQFLFFRQWKALRLNCQEKGVGLIGDLPIFVAHDSADVWANRELFLLDQKGNPTCVAGCPPDYFSRTGQRWGNPLYKWDALKKTHYDWWIKRFQTTFQLFDAVRLDHFIGFHNFWRIPAADKTAEHGQWILAPGEDFFKTVFKKLGKLELIAEDLGEVTPAVVKLRDKFKLPGMRILQFAFSGDAKNPFLPHNFVKNTVVYTGTHDNDTTVGWFKSLTPVERQRVLNYLGLARASDIHWALIQLAYASMANTAIVPLQDILGLGSKARMNIPGTARGNWTWRMPGNSLSPSLAHRLAAVTDLYGRK